MSEVMANRIGRYELAGQLGDGPFGQFFRAYDPATGRDVAVQVIKLDPKAPAAAREAALREARSAGTLSHPSIAAVFDIGSDGDLAYVVREYVEGLSLSKHASEAAPFRPTALLAWLDQIADALDYAHGRGVVHGGLEPSCVLVADDGTVKVTGFGCAKLAAKSAGALGGTPEYMAPERIRGEQVGPASDVYSLGAVMYELVSGRRPFAAESAVATIFKAVNESAPSIAGIAPEASSDVDAVIQRAMAKNATERTTTCRELVDAFRVAANLAATAEEPVNDLDGLISAIFCDQCGTALRPGVKFCYKCGSATVAAQGLDDDEAVAVTAAPVPDVAPVPPPIAPVPPPVVPVPPPVAPAPRPVSPVVSPPLREPVPSPAVVHPTEVAEALPRIPLATEVAPAPTLPTEKAPAPFVERNVAPPLAKYATRKKGSELPPPGADLSGKPKTGLMSGVLPVVIVLLLILFLFGLFGFMVAPRLLAPRDAPAAPAQTSSVAVTGSSSRDSHGSLH